MNHWKRLVGSVAVCLSVLLSGCASDGWDLPDPARTGVDPLPGGYTFDQEGCFSVREVNGRKVLVFASDCFRFDTIEIQAGGFAHTHGEIGGTDCPTDAYAISGAFTSPTRAEGTIQYGFDCRVTKETRFVAEFSSGR